MQRPRISVVMIVKDEAPRIGACLGSLTTLGSLLHEVCIYDTGSSDDTVAIARRYGAWVQEGYWDDDFARARNTAAAMATGDWLFVVDADEQVRSDARELERLLVQAGDVPDGFYVSAQINRMQIGGEDVWASPRLYRPGRLHYHRPVHTELVRRDGEFSVLWVVPEATALLINSGFDTDRVTRSLALKDRLTSTIIDSTSDGSLDGQALTDRARARMGQGRFAEAIEDLRVADALRWNRRTTYVAWRKELLVYALLRESHFDEADVVVASLEEFAPGRPFTRWLRGKLRTAQGRHEEAFEEWATISGAVDAGFTPLQARDVYRACLESAIAQQSAPRIIASLVGLVGIESCMVDYGPLLARWWGDLPAGPLCRALAICGDRPVGLIGQQFLDQGNVSAHLGRRLLDALAESGNAPSLSRDNRLESGNDSGDAVGPQFDTVPFGAAAPAAP